MKYRKKPVVIDAWKWDGTGSQLAEIEKQIGKPLAFEGRFLMIPTLESPHEASVGDFIIKGVAGEFYPIKEKIFYETYEKAE